MANKTKAEKLETGERERERELFYKNRLFLSCAI